jgi:hypothetical protein
MRACVTRHGAYTGKGFVYLISDAYDELPCAVFDSYEDAIKYIGCSPATFYRMIAEYRTHGGYRVEKVFLDKSND